MGDLSLMDSISQLCDALSRSPQLIRSILYQNPDFESIREHDFNSPAYYVLPQICSNTSCGWGGVVGHGFTDFWLVCVAYPSIEVAIVYVKRAAYICKFDEAFNEYIAKGEMPLWDQVEKSKLSILWKAQK